MAAANSLKIHYSVLTIIVALLLASIGGAIAIYQRLTIVETKVEAMQEMKQDINYLRTRLDSLFRPHYDLSMDIAGID